MGLALPQLNICACVISFRLCAEASTAILYNYISQFTIVFKVFLALYGVRVTEKPAGRFGDVAMKWRYLPLGRRWRTPPVQFPERRFTRPDPSVREIALKTGPSRRLRSKEYSKAVSLVLVQFRAIDCRKAVSTDALRRILDASRW